MRLLAVIALLLPTTALAQPGGEPPPPPPGEPAPPPMPPQPGMQPMQPIPPPVPPSGFALHRGLTFEANLGVGFAHLSGGGMSINTDASLAGADIGLGGWLTPQLALTGRITGNELTYMGVPASGQGELVNAFIGPSLQYWIDPNMWIGGGVGFTTFRFFGGNCNSNGPSDQCGTNGWGFDVRAGYSFGGASTNTFNVSLELTPSIYSQANSDGTSSSVTVTGVSFLLGYQYL